MLTTGPHPLTARYDGDTNNSQSLSPKILVSVQSFAATAVTLPVTIDTNPYFSANYADFNNDGKTDIAAVDISYTLRIFLGNGDGTFIPAGVTYPSVLTFVFGDFNGDGNTDIAFASQVDGSIEVLFGNGDGTFRTGPANTTSVEILGAADFDGNGTVDLVVAYSGGYGVMLGNGDGTFGPPHPFAAGYPQSTAIAIADFNGDGRPDVVTANLYFYAGNGDGTFASGVPIQINAYAQYMTAADVNNDGKLDLVIATNDYVNETLTGNGNGTFQVVTSPTP